MRLKTTIVGCLLACSFTSVATARWTSVAHVERIRHYVTTGDEYRIDIWFDVDVASDCSTKNRVRFSTTDSTVFTTMQKTLHTAFLTKSRVEVNTRGCRGSYGKLDYISLK